MRSTAFVFHCSILRFVSHLESRIEENLWYAEAIILVSMVLLDWYGRFRSSKLKNHVFRATIFVVCERPFNYKKLTSQKKYDFSYVHFSRKYLDT